jgi:alginate O-acetyltransferase complex protein AlgI
VLFNSWIFAVYLPLVLLCYYSLARRAQNIFLVVASYVFYGWWDYRFCALLAVSTIVDFLCGRGIDRTSDARRRKTLLIVSCITNLGILGFFKYFNFFVDSVAEVLTTLGFQVHAPTLNIILPVGISFYTFQTLSYTIDVYRGQLKSSKHLSDFALYVSFFPQLVAGPIERATRLLPQIERKRTVTWEHLSSGGMLILIGLFRKVAIADGLAVFVGGAFAEADTSSSMRLLVGLYMFSLQIYGDFAGYSDMARGVSRLLGFDLIENFQHPYFSTSITEFWRRWHVSLSSWLRDYLYIPLGGNRGGPLSTYRNLFATMLLGGLWHGANWTFVIWGGLHGVFLAIHKLILGDRRPQVENRKRTIAQWPVEFLKMFMTFHLVALTWIFFRAQDFGTAWTYLRGIIFWSGGLQVEGMGRLVVSGLLLYFVDIVQYRSSDHTAPLKWRWYVRGGFYALLVISVFALRGDGAVPFIYFQF